MKSVRCALLGLALLAAPASPSHAHEGPPYPVLVDGQAGPYTLSVWADPDLGTGTFFVLFDPPLTRSAPDPQVHIEVWPSTSRLPPVRGDAHRQPDDAFMAQVPFDREEPWKVKLHVQGPLGEGETILEVQVTAPGYGRWDLVIYFTPFLLLGGLWVLVSIQRRTPEVGRRSP